MTLRIDLKSSAPVYRQIVDGLRILLVNGELKAGDQLPPVRRLAMDLGVHFNTVAEAYRTLGGEGWLEIGRRSGAQVISRRTPDQPNAKESADFQQRVRELLAEAQSRGVPRGSLANDLRQAAEALERN